MARQRPTADSDDDDDVADHVPIPLTQVCELKNHSRQLNDGRFYSLLRRNANEYNPRIKAAKAIFKWLRLQVPAYGRRPGERVCGETPRARRRCYSSLWLAKALLSSLIGIELLLPFIERRRIRNVDRTLWVHSAHLSIFRGRSSFLCVGRNDPTFGLLQFNYISTTTANLYAACHISRRIGSVRASAYQANYTIWTNPSAERTINIGNN